MLQVLIRLYLLMICLNGGIYFITTSTPFGVDLGGNTNLILLGDTFEEQKKSLQISVIPLGDFIAGLQVLINVISGSFIISTLQLFGLSSSFITVLQIILSFATVMSIIYMISGRFNF